MPPVLRLAMLLTAFVIPASAWAADWEVRTVSEGKKNACTAVSAKRGISDGYQDVTAWIVVDAKSVAVQSDSVLDLGSSDIGVKVGNRDLVRADRLGGKHVALFTSGYADLVQLFRAGKDAQVQLRFWPTWPATGTHSATFSLIGFTKAYDEAMKCAP